MPPVISRRHQAITSNSCHDRTSSTLCDCCQTIDRERTHCCSSTSAWLFKHTHAGSSSRGGWTFIQSGVGAAALSLETTLPCFISCSPFLLGHDRSGGGLNPHPPTSTSNTDDDCISQHVAPLPSDNVMTYLSPRVQTTLPRKLNISIHPRWLVKIKGARPNTNSGDTPTIRGTRTGWGVCGSELHTARKGHQEGENREQGIEGHTK
ncbi:unnamed protein product [Ectocarpus sp. 12 AP-2014]